MPRKQRSAAPSENASSESPAAKGIIKVEQVLSQMSGRFDPTIPHEPSLLTGLSTGFTELDEKIAGLQPSDLVVIASRPGAGKSAFALNIIRHMATEAMQPSLVICLEQRQDDFASRLLCCEARIDTHQFRQNRLSASERTRLREAEKQLRKVKIFIDDAPRISLERLSTEAKELVSSEGVRLIVIDPVHLIQPSNPGEGRHEQIGLITRELKSLARELSVPVVVVAYISRSYNGDEAPPRLADLRETGMLAEVADTVLLLHPVDSRDQNSGEAICEINIAKQRNGPTGCLALMFNQVTMRFESMFSREFDYSWGDQAGVPPSGA